MTSPGPDTPYWSQDAAALSAVLESGPGGLSSESAAAKLRLVGPNSVEDASHLSVPRLLLRQIESPLMLILIGLSVWPALVSESSFTSRDATPYASLGESPP